MSFSLGIKKWLFGQKRTFFRISELYIMFSNKPLDNDKNFN